MNSRLIIEFIGKCRPVFHNSGDKIGMYSSITKNVVAENAEDLLVHGIVMYKRFGTFPPLDAQKNLIWSQSAVSEIKKKVDKAIKL